jgi:hypothetical protein
MPDNPTNGSRTPLPPLLLLHPDDNILVARRDIAAGERVEIDGESFVVPAAAGRSPPKRASSNTARPSAR